VCWEDGRSRAGAAGVGADEQHTLENWAKRRSTAQDLALRARIVLASAEGHNNIAAAARLGVSRNTVTKWRAWFLASRLDGLGDEPRPECRGRSPMPTWRRWWCAPWKRCPRGHALVQTGAGQAGGDLADQRAPDLAGVRAAALAHGRLQDLPGPAADRQDPRRDRPVPGAAGERGSLRSRREAARLTIPSLRSSRPVMRDADTRVDLHTDYTERVLFVVGVKWLSGFSSRPASAVCL